MLPLASDSTVPRSTSTAGLAFPSVRWALHHYREVCDQPVSAARTNPPGEHGDY